MALVGATVFDGSSPQPQVDQVIIVRNDKIEAIGTRAEVDVPRRMRTVDLTGKFIVPGLIDGHVHLQRWTLPRFLAAGVTSVRDVHGPFDSILALREQANLGSLTSPRIFSAGAMIDAAPATYSDAFVVGGANDARKAVDKLAVTGVDYVKTYTRITPDLMRAIVDEAQTFGLRVTAHLGLTDAVTAGDMGVRAIEHMSGVPEAIVANNAADLCGASRGLLRRLDGVREGVGRARFGGDGAGGGEAGGRPGDDRADAGAARDAEPAG